MPVQTKIIAKPTPGPWSVEPFDWDARPDACDNDVEYFATIYGRTKTGTEFIIADMCGVTSGIYANGAGTADARLIAAAPDMLTALENIVCPDCNHTLGMHADKYGCEVDRGDRHGEKGCEAMGPCGCTLKEATKDGYEDLLPVIQAIRRARGKEL